MGSQGMNVRCLASTTASQQAHHEADQSDKEVGLEVTSCIEEAQLSPDSTCVFTSDHSRQFSVYPIDTTTSSEDKPRTLKPYAQFKAPNPIWAFAVNPLFNFQDASSTHVLVSQRDSYISLHNALWDITKSYDAADAQTSNASPINISKAISSYKLIDRLTEAVTAPLSLAYSHNGAHFFAGRQSAIVTFDLEYSDDPIHTILTIPSKRNKMKGGGRGFKGCISALSLSPPTSTFSGGLLAAGSRTRYIGIYNSMTGEEVTHFALPGAISGGRARNDDLRKTMGNAVSHLKWSPCARYLYVAERRSDAILIYDVRNFSLSLGYCAGRNALTNQKSGFDIWNAGASPYDIEAMSHEIWAGGSDGKIRVWKDPYMKEGAIEADEVVQIHDGNLPVVSTLVHPSGNLAIAASGAREIEDDASIDTNQGVWARPMYTERGSLDIFSLS